MIKIDMSETYNSVFWDLYSKSFSLASFVILVYNNMLTAHASTSPPMIFVTKPQVIQDGVILFNGCPASTT